MTPANRVNNITEGIFDEVAVLAKKLLNEGKEIINLSVGSPDLPPALEIRKKIASEVMEEDNYGYALTSGLPEFRNAIAEWYLNNHFVELDPELEILPLMGSQDGLAHIFWSYINQGDYALIPDPGYPVYTDALLLAEGIPYYMNLTKENNYLPDFSTIPDDIAQKTKIMILNYPSNPLAVTANTDFFIEALSFAKKNNILLCHDFAYSELAYDGFSPESILSIPDAKKHAVEFHSLSKSFNLAGIRLGFITGNKEAIAALKKVKSNIDFGSFKAFLKVGAWLLKEDKSKFVISNAMAYQRRRDVLLYGLEKAGWRIDKPNASMFVWAKIPCCGLNSRDFAYELARNTGVIVVPGIAFGKNGEGYIRIGLVADENKLERAAELMGNFYREKNNNK